MVLKEEFRGFPQGHPVEIINVDKAPDGFERVQLIGDDQTVMQCWCPYDLIQYDPPQLADGEPEEPAPPNRVAAAEIAKRFGLKGAAVSIAAKIIEQAYEPTIVEFQKIQADHVRLKNKWRTAWMRRNEKIAEYEEFVNGGESDPRMKAAGHLTTLIRVIKDLKSLKGEQNAAALGR